MKTLIAYAGDSGTTEKCAHLLANQINHEHAVDVVDLSKTTPHPDEYEMVVVGSNIHMGQLHKCVRKFIKQYASVLKHKHTAYYICCGFIENQEKLFAADFPKELLDHAQAALCFGGEMDISRLHGLNKLIAKIAAKSAAQETPPLCIQQNQITKMADMINRLN